MNRAVPNRVMATVVLPIATCVVEVWSSFLCKSTIVLPLLKIRVGREVRVSVMVKGLRKFLIIRY